MNGTDARIGFALHITLLMAFDGLRGIVDRFGPDHTNQGSCVYMVEHKGALTPVCIVGQFFHDFGILRTLIAPKEMHRTMTGGAINPAESGWDSAACNLGGLSSQVRDHLAETYGITFDDTAWALLREAQRLQDGGNTWSYSLEESTSIVMAQFGIVPPETRTAVERLNAAIEADLA